MKTGRNILISAILALSASGSIVAAAAAPAIASGSAVVASGSAVVASGTASAPQTYYRG